MVMNCRNNGLMHHNVIWNVQGGIMVKGLGI